MTRILFILGFTALGSALLAATAVLAPTADQQTAGGALVAGFAGGFLCLVFALAIALGAAR